MDPIRKTVLISLLSLFIGLASLPCQGQFFWLGFQAGEGVSWFSHQDQDNIQLSAGAGTSISIFLRYGTRPYYQLAFEWLFSTNQMKFEVTQVPLPMTMFRSIVSKFPLLRVMRSYIGPDSNGELEGACSLERIQSWHPIPLISQGGISKNPNTD